MLKNIIRLVTPTGERREIRLGDVVEKAVKPFAKALRAKCLDEKGNLKPETRCAKRKTKWNRVRLKLP